MEPLLLLLAFGCTPPPTADSTVAVLDPEAIARPTGRLIGWNLGRGTLYAAEDDTLHPEWRTAARERAIAELSTIRAPYEDPYMRFSGLQIDGVLGGDGYHFEPLVDPQRGADADDNMAVFQYMALMEEAGASPLVTLNFGSGTADEAARYVRHLNGEDAADDLVAYRYFWGQTDGYDQKHFEIGNETYGFWNTGNSGTGRFSYANPDAENGGDPDWHGRPASSAADAAARGLAYVEAVIAVQPDARLWWPISQADFEGWGGPEQAVADLRPLLEHPNLTAVVVHHYQVDDSATRGMVAINSPQVAMAGSSLLEPGYLQLRAALEGLDRDEPMQLAITEYGVAGVFAGPEFSLGRTAAMGLGTADMLIAFSNWGVDHAAQHIALNWDPSESELLLEDWYRPYRFEEEGGAGAIYELPTARVTRLFADHMRPNTLDIDWTVTEVRRGGDGSEGSPLFNYDRIAGTAFVNDDGDEMTILLLNRDIYEHETVRLEVPPEWVPASRLQWAPNSWDYNVHQQPPYDPSLGTPEETWPVPDVPLTQLALRAYRGAFDVDVPHNAVAAIVFEKR